MAWEYSEKTKRLFMDAVAGKPGTHLGQVDNPDGVGTYGSIVCGDAMEFTFRVRRDPDPLKDVIVEARYLTFGCTSAIASSEALCRLLEEKEYTPIGALKIRNKDIADYLDGLPRAKLHCSVMGADALESAVFDWATRRGVDLAAQGVDAKVADREEGRIVCNCFTISEPYLQRKIREMNLKTIPEITEATKAGGGCTSCHHGPGGLQDLLDGAWGKKGDKESSPEAAPPGPTPFQLLKVVEEVVARIRHDLNRDGGDIEIVDFRDKILTCRLRGACAGCASAGQTLKFGVEGVLQREVDPGIRVVAV